MTTRAASHAGSWYERRGQELSKELSNWLHEVPDSIDGTQLPIPGARVIIAPHAGYSYSGPTAAWAYKALDVSNAKRIFLLGPSHALYLEGCALTTHAKYATPMGNLTVDTAIVAELKESSAFVDMSTATDEKEHSLEMHLPYIYKILSDNFSSPDKFPTIVPVLVGNTNEEKEKEYGQIFARYLSDTTNVFIVSSDFCHWGLRFQYTYYLPDSPSGTSRTSSGYDLKPRDRRPTNPTIYQSIGRLDKQAMDAIETGIHQNFLNNLKETSNTVCGRHPIGVMMAAIEGFKNDPRILKAPGDDNCRFKFIRYERNEDVEEIRDSSVSYASAYARVRV